MPPCALRHFTHASRTSRDSVLRPENTDDSVARWPIVKVGCARRARACAVELVDETRITIAPTATHRRPLDGLLDRTLRRLLRRTLHRGRALDSFLDRALCGLLGAPLHRAFCGRRSRCRGRRRCGGNRGFTEKACRPRRTSQRWVRRPRGCHPSLPSEDVDHVAIAA